jgi:MATE family multidrug resistance protein
MKPDSGGADEIGAGSPLSRFLRLAGPNVLANLMVPVAGLVDTALLGHLPDIRFLAGVGLAAIIFDYLYWSFGFLRMGTTGLTAQALGAGDRRRIEVTLFRAGALALALGLLVWVVALPVERLAFWLLDGSAEVEAAGSDYFRGRVLGAPAAFINFVIIGSFLGRQQVKKVLLVSVVGNLANILLDLTFIMGLGWGSWGAGLATALSQLGMLVVGLALLRPWESWREHQIDKRSLFELDELKRFAALSGDILVRTFSLLTAFALFTNFSAAMGTVVLTANAVLLKGLSTAAFVIDGYAFAAEGMAGHAAGRRDPRALRDLLVVGIPIALATGLAFGLAFYFAPQLFALLTDHVEVLDAVEAARGWLLAVLLFSSVAYLLDGYFLGLSAGPTLRRAMVVSLLMGFVPLALYARYWGGGVSWLWAAMVTFMLFRAITLGMGVPKTLKLYGKTH